MGCCSSMISYCCASDEDYFNGEEHNTRVQSGATNHVKRIQDNQVQYNHQNQRRFSIRRLSLFAYRKNTMRRNDTGDNSDLDESSTEADSDVGQRCDILDRDNVQEMDIGYQE